ncbi:AraC family transcriptional regulator [Mycobacteriaceae bacterium NPDC060252]
MHATEGARRIAPEEAAGNRRVEQVATTVPIRRVEAFVALALREGWDIEGILRDASISPALFADGRSRVTYEQLTRVVRALWAQTDDELAGLGPAPLPRGSARLIGCALFSNAPDLGSMMDRFVELHRALPGLPPAQITRDTEELTIAFDFRGVERPVDLVVEGLLACFHRIIEWGIGRRVPLRHVELPYARPDDVDDYGQLFGAPVRFSEPLPALVIDTAVFSAPIIRTEADFDDFIRRSPEDLMFRRRQFEASTAEQVRRMTELGIGGQWPTASDIAEQLGLSVQTVHRRLKEENTSIRGIRDDVLRDAAVESLSRGQETIAALSERLGFSEPSAFTRAFRRWTGSAPRSYQPHESN